MATKNRKKLIWILLAVLIIFVVVAIVRGGSSGAVSIEVEEARERQIEATVSASGKVFPVDELIIISEIAGEITDLYVQEGDSVKEGDPLVKINPNIYQDAVKRAEASVLTAKANLGNARSRYKMSQAQFKKAEQDYKRQKGLYDEGVISESEMESAQTNFEVAENEMEAAHESVEAARYSVQSAEATLEEAHNNLSKTTIYAPMEGIITSLDVEEGKVVGGISTFSATEMMRVSNLSNMEVQVDVNENDVLNIDIGDTAAIDVEAYDNREFRGVVTQISSSATTSGTQQLTTEQVTNFTVKIRILPSSYQDIFRPASGRFPFLPGMSATVDIITETKRDVVTVPIEAVTTRRNIPSDTAAGEANGHDDFKEVVFVIDDNKAILTVVTTGIQDDRYIEITEGLQAGSQVARGPYTTVQQLLEDGDEVEVENGNTKDRDPS